ncbi:MAG: hypothetical protein JXA21_19975 [Anaerolineae bacterium]|nr:hypothetical protein [Anaerolineae bacterium]
MHTKWFRISLILMILLTPFGGIQKGIPVLAQESQPPLNAATSALSRNPSAPDCALLDNPATRSMLSGATETALLRACGREAELAGDAVGAVHPQVITALGNDVQVNNPAGDATSWTQSNAAVARNADTGVLCAAYTDSYHGIVEETGYTGFSNSTDSGATWVDRGSLNNVDSLGSPSIVWRRANGRFFLATLYDGGLGLWDLNTRCEVATWKELIHTGSGEKVALAVDNNPDSPYYGWLYAAWTDLTNGHIYVARSESGPIWSVPVDVSGHDLVNGASLAVDPISNDVYVAWTHWDTQPDGPIDIEMARSTNGGSSWSPITNPVNDRVNPRDVTATSICGRPALNGNIQYSPFPQIAVDRRSTLHVVYSYDPDGYGYGDVVNIYYRRSTDRGATWKPELQVNDNGNQTDQFSPALAVGETGEIGVFWYDRRMDATRNLSYDRYMAISRDGGQSFEANQRLSDESSPVAAASGMAACYFSDHDGTTASGGYFYAVWSDNRRGDADVWSDSEPYFWSNLGGTVYDATTYRGLPGAWVGTVHTTTGTPFSTGGDEGGNYALNVPDSESYGVRAWVYGYASNTVTTTVGKSGGRADIPLSALNLWNVSGRVSDATTGQPLYAHITVSGNPMNPPAPYDAAWSSAVNGNYTLPNLAGDITYTLTVVAEGYIPQSYSLGELTGHRADLNFALQADMATCSAPGYEWAEIFYDGFESGVLDAAWASTVTADGRVTVTTGYPYAGNYSVLLDDAVGDANKSQARISTVQDFSALNNVSLDFWWREFEDENDPEDGVFISDDGGASWYRAFSFNGGPEFFRHDLVDIAGVAAANGLSLNTAFQIKFQFYDDGSVPDDGYAIDEVRLRTCRLTTGAALAPAGLEVAGCPGTPQTHEMVFVNRSGVPDEVRLTYVTGAGLKLDAPASLGVVQNGAIRSFNVQTQIDKGVSLNTSIYATVTAYLAGHPAISDTLVIEKRAARFDRPWEWEDDVPVTAFYRGAGATLDGGAGAGVYVIGGQTGAGVALSNVARYRPADGWQKMDNKPTPAGNIDAAELNGKIYVAGGYDGGNLAAFEVFDPAQPAGSQWNIAASLPVSISGGAMAAACDKVYLMGGSDSSDSAVNTVYVYDPTDPGAGWASAAAMPQPQRYASAVAARGLIFAVGDWDTGTRVQVYDCVANTWLSGYPQLKVERQSPGTAAIQNRYIVTYGGAPAESHAGHVAVEILDLDNLAAGWQTGPLMNQGRAGSSGGVTGGRLIAVGGNDALGYATNTVESVAFCPECASGVSAAKSGPEWPYSGDVIAYSVVITRPNWLTGTVTLADVLPAGVDFAGGLSASSGTAWYSDTNRTIYWAATPGPEYATPGTVIETFTNTWGSASAGLTYNPETGSVRYVHETGSGHNLFDVAYTAPHPVLRSFSLSEMNPGWSTLQNGRTGAGYDVGSGHYFLTDYAGNTLRNDNYVEVDALGKIINAWELDGTDNDSYNGFAMDNVVDIAAAPGTPTRYFATRLNDGSEVYELDLIKAGQFAAGTWGHVNTCNVPGILDTAGIDYDAQNGVLYHSDWGSNKIVVTDLRCNVRATFTCGAANAHISGVTFIEKQWPPEVWAIDYDRNVTTRCTAPGRELLSDVVTVTFNVTVTAPASTPVVNAAVLGYTSAKLPAPSILHLRTVNTSASVQRALDKLGYGYDTRFATDWSNIDFTPYDVVIVGMDEGAVNAASIQKLRTDVIDRGKRVIFLGGAAQGPFVEGVNQYLVANVTNNYAWTLTASPHFVLSPSAHPLARGLPSSRNFVTNDARYYQLRVTDPAIETIARNGDNQPAYFRKTYPGGGTLIWFIQSPKSSYWTNPGDFQILKRIIANAMPDQTLVAEHTFHTTGHTAITWTKEVYVNGDYLGQYDEGPFTVVPTDEVQVVDRLDYTGQELILIRLATDWSGQPVALADEYHTRGVIVAENGDWYVTLPPNTGARLVKTLHINGPAAITEWLHPEGMAAERRDISFQPPVFAMEGPAVAYNGQTVTYTITFTSQDSLVGPLRLTDTLPAGLEFAGILQASYGQADYDNANDAIYWTNTPAFETTQQTTEVTPAETTMHVAPVIRSTAGLLASAAPQLALAPSASWYDAAPLPQGVARYAHAQCPGDLNRFYVIAGASGSATDKVWRYDASADTWTALSPFPVAARDLSAICYQGRLYVTGGATKQFYIYDILRDSWSKGPALPRNVWGAAMGAWDGQIFVAGGDNDFISGGQSAEVDIYDIATGYWRTDGTPMPEATVASGWVQVGEYLYVAGGRGSLPESNSDTTQRYHMATNAWEVGPAFDSRRADFALAATGQHLYAIGGDANGGGVQVAVTLTEQLDYTQWSSGSVWTDTVDPLPAALAAFGGGFCTMARSGGEIWAVGGQDADAAPVTANQYRPSEPCVVLPDSVVITFTAKVTAGAGEHVTNTAQMDVRGSILTDEVTFILPLPDWQKQINGAAWKPGFDIVIADGNRVTVTDVISTSSAFTLRETWDSNRLQLIGYDVPAEGVVERPWQAAGDMPFAYTRFDAEYSNATGHVYFLGGRLADDSTSGRVWEFDPATGVYTDTGVDMPTPVSNYNIALLTDGNGDEVLVTFGGRPGGGGVVNVVQGFYPVSRTTVVFSADPYPVATSPGGVAVVDNLAYAFGGFDAAVVISDTYIFDIAAADGARWTSGPALNHARSYIGAAVVDGVIYAIGGDIYTGTTLIPLTITEKLDTAATPLSWDDAGVADLPVTCDQMRAFGFDTDAPYDLAGSIVVAGCGRHPGEFADGLRYDVAGNTWDESFPDLNQARRNHAGTLIPEGPGTGMPGLWVWGGRQGRNSNVLNSAEFYPLVEGILDWRVPTGTTQPLTLTKVFYVQPDVWPPTTLDEILNIGPWSETKPVIIKKQTSTFYTLTVKTAGAGSGVVTPPPGTHYYLEGTSVTLTAVANTGSIFAGWGDDLSGTDPVTTVVVDKNVVATAVFNLEGTCVEVSSVKLRMITAGTLYTDTIIQFQAVISPATAIPYTYTVNYGEGAGEPVMTLNNPLVLQHTFPTTGSKSIVVAAWNCGMTTPIKFTLPVIIVGAGDVEQNIYLPMVLRAYTP